MSQKDFQDLIHRSPFQAFRLHIVDGKSLRVSHPDFLLVTASNLAVAQELPDGSPGELNVIPYEHIARIEMLSRKTRRAA